MDLEAILKSGLLATVFSGIFLLISRQIDRHKAKHVIKAEVGVDYERQITFLNGQVAQLNIDVHQMRQELRLNSKREHSLYLMIHQHCQQSPGCSPWFDAELTKIDRRQSGAR